MCQNTHNDQIWYLRVDPKQCQGELIPARGPQTPWSADAQYRWMIEPGDAQHRRMMMANSVISELTSYPDGHITYIGQNTKMVRYDIQPTRTQRQSTTPGVVLFKVCLFLVCWSSACQLSQRPDKLSRSQVDPRGAPDSLEDSGNHSCLFFDNFLGCFWVSLEVHLNSFFLL